LEPAAEFPQSAGPLQPVAVEPAPPAADQHAPIWLQRTYLAIYVVFCLWMGMVLVVLPWTPTWTENSILLDYPAVRAFLSQNFMRGIVSGIGLVDMWLGIWEAVHYREHRVR
jgi:hypothetical protein